MNAYELVLLVDPDLPEDRRTGVISAARKLVEAAATQVVKDEDWGVRKLAYEIDHRLDAAYHVIDFDCEPSNIEDLGGKLRITDGLLRFRILRRPKRSAGSSTPTGDVSETPSEPATA